MTKESEDLEREKETLRERAMMRVYYAAKEGFCTQLLALLSEIKDEEERRAIVNQEFYEDDHQVYTPLIVATLNGHLEVVHILLELAEPDLEKEGCVKVHGELTDGATALWVAAGVGRRNIVKMLLQHGAQVDHCTKKGSTPLRAACFEGRLDVIQYLIEHGANVCTANMYNNTCVMIAAYKNYTDVLQYLLEKGAKVNEQAQCGASALYYAAECGHVEVCEILLDNGAVLSRNTFGLTPALAAAERTREAVVQVFLQRPGLLTKVERIEVMELLGASYANDKDNYSLVKAFHYLLSAMELRYEDPDNILRKPFFEPVPAYEHWVECQTLQDLLAIRYNHNSLHMESLTIRERILGQNPEVAHAIVFRGAICADNGRFDRCESLWLHALRLRQQNGLQVQRDLLRFVQLFSQEYSINETIRFDSVIAVLGACVDELRYNQQKMANPGPREDLEAVADNYEMNIVTVLYLITIITKLLRKEQFVRTEEQTLQMYQMVYQLNLMMVRLRDDQTLLHLAVNGVTPVDDFHTDDVCRYEWLLELLQSAVLRMPDANVKTVVKEITEMLIEAGIHLDAVNADGLKASQVCVQSCVAAFIKSYETRAINLRCLAARVIAQHRIPYRKLIPRQLEAFVQLHCTPKS
ncbi:AGAP007382-PA [Anopheles gambiae str. PEST]|uniref:AGAP007382-PA n=1 Tax=Anopheles gambiae TaxID=7165 RepID=Q7QJA5_ANOGA|nr:AGAP007382-PA [Anopheles gambiae str. PEST]